MSLQSFLQKLESIYQMKLEKPSFELLAKIMQEIPQTSSLLMLLLVAPPQKVSPYR